MAKKITVKKNAVLRTQKAPKVGRPKGSGKFGCETKVIRVPVHMVDDILVFINRKIKTDKRFSRR